jgi:hypothetical protein
MDFMSYEETLDVVRRVGVGIEEALIQRPAVFVRKRA